MSFLLSAFLAVVAAGGQTTLRADANFVITEVAGRNARVEIIASNFGGVVYGRSDYELPPHGRRVVDLHAVLTKLSAADVTIRVVAGDGKVVVSRATPPPAPSPIVSCPFKGAPFADPVTRLCFVRNRWFDPRTGTFLTPDPAGSRDSSNLYAFCGGDPVNCSDPSGLAASLGRSGWIVATDNRNGGRMVRFSPKEIAANPRSIRAFLGRYADVDPREADDLIERAGAAWLTNRDTLRAVAPRAATAAGVYPLMAMTAGAGLGGGAGAVVATDLGFGFAGSTLLPGFTGGLGSQAGHDLAVRRFSGTRQYAIAGTTGAVSSFVLGGILAGAGRLVGGPSGVPSIEGATPPDWHIPDDAFVRFDASKYDDVIDKFGIRVDVLSDHKAWMTTYGSIRDVEDAAMLETMLYRQDLWPRVAGRFGHGATLRLVRNVPDAWPAGITNRVNGVPQFRVLRNIPPSDLSIIRRLPGYE